MRVTPRFPALLLLVLMLLGAGEAEAQTYSTWAHNRILAFNTTAGGLNIPGNTLNYPLLIPLTASNFNFAEALNNGEDIRFEDPDGTPLAYHIEAWDAGSQFANVWVKVPQIDGNSINDYIRMFWGKAGATNESNGANVFSNGGGNHIGVWHLNEDGNNTVSGYLDASAGAFHGTGTSMNNATDVAGQVLNGQNFNGSTQTIDLGGGSGLSATSALTLQTWVKITSKTANAPFITKPYSTNATPFNEYFLGIDNVASKFSFTLAIGGTRYVLNSIMTPSTGTWYMVTATYDGSTMRLYVNGTLDNTLSQAGTINNYGQGVRLAKYTHAAQYFNGTLDEVRISSVNRSAILVLLDYSTQDMNYGLDVWGPRVWDGGGGDDFWSTGANWNCDVPPTGDEHVLFDASTSDNVTLDANVGVQSLIMTSGYLGAFAFSNRTLTILKGPADFRSGGSISAGTGSLIFASPMGLNFHPRAGATFPAISQNAAGTTTVLSNALTAGNLTLAQGAFDLGASMTHTVGAVTGSGTLLFGTSNLNTTGNVNLSAASLVATASNTLAFTGGAAQTYTANTSEPDLNLTQNGSGGTTILANNITTPTLSISAGTLNLGTGLTHTVTTALTIGGGGLNFGSSTLKTAGPVVNLSNLSPLTAGTGTLELTNTVAQTFYPNSSAAVPAILKSGSGTTTLSSNNLTAAGLTISGGTLNLGAGLSHSVASFSASAGTLDFNSSTLQVTGAGNVNLNGLGTVTAGTGTLEFLGTGAKTLTPKSGGYLPSLKTTGLGTVTVASYNLTTNNVTLDAGTLDIGSLNMVVNGDLSVAGGTLTAVNGTLDINGNVSVTSGTLSLPSNYATVTGNIFTAGGATLTHNSGLVYLDGNAAGKTVELGGALNALNVNGSGGGAWTLTNNGVMINQLIMTAGTLNLGSGLTSTTSNFSASGGTLEFNSGILQMHSGSMNLNGLTTLTRNTGTLRFIGSGTQVFTPKSGQDHPAIEHSDASTLQLASYDLSCASFSNSAGILNLNGRNITTIASGNFTITNGTASTLAGLGGRTITVAGNASLSGAVSTNRLNLNPGAAWYLDVEGTLTASLATLGSSDAGASNTAGSCSNCANLGTNTNWTSMVYWDGGGADANWSTVANWGSDYLPDYSDAVTFNATSANATLDGGHTVNSITFTSGYTGTFNFASGGLTLDLDNADFRSGGAILPGTGTLYFASNTPQIFIPKPSTTFPRIVQFGAGGTTVSTNALTANILELAPGASFNLGSSMTHTVGTISGDGNLNFGTSNLNATGNVNLGSATVTATSANTLAFTGSSAQTYTPDDAEPDLNLTQNGSGGTTVATYNFTTATLSIVSGTFNLGTSRTHNAASLSLPGGSLDFGTSTLRTSSATVDFRDLATLSAGSGTLEFTGGSAQTYHPNGPYSCPAIIQSGAGTTTLASNSLASSALTISAGTFNLGAGLTHVAGSLATSGGTLTFNTSTLNISSGNANLSGLSTLNPNTGTLGFTNPSGPQILTPKNGVTHPAITHGAAGTLQLASYDLSCASFTQSAGTLDFNGRNIITVSSGNFTINNGNSSSLTGLGGRTLTVDGNATFNGATSTDMLNLNPGTAWYLNATGTAGVQLASVNYGDASGGSTVACSNCFNFGNTTNWAFTVVWDGGGSDNNWTTSENWGSDAMPGSFEDVVFNGTSVKNAVLNTATSLKSITFASGYTGTFSFSSNTLSINAGNADFRSGGTITAATGTLAFTGTNPQTFIPKSGATMPPIVQSGSGTTTVTTNSLNSPSLTLNAGTFNLGPSGLHTLGTISGSGAIDFGSGLVNATGNVDLSSATATASFNTMSFTGSSAQTYTPNASLTTLNLTQDGTGGTTFLTNNATVPTLTITSGTLNLGTGLTITTQNFTATGGGIDFGSSTLRAGNTTAVDFRGLASVIAGTGTLEFPASSSVTFFPKSGATHPAILKSGTAGVTLSTNGLTTTGVTVTTGTLTLATALTSTGAISVTGGILSLSSGLTHTAASMTSSGGTLTFNTSVLRINSGNADLSGLATLNANTGSLQFIAASGTQTLTPKNGTNHPIVSHTGAGTLRLAAYDLSCLAFSQSAGVLDLNGRNISTYSSGSFTVTNGNASTFTGLAGRTITVAGNASLAGTSGANRLNLDPGAAWYLNASGTASVQFASANNANSAGYSTVTCSNCANGGTSQNWVFNVAWDGGGGDANWSTAQNWGSDAIPTSQDNVLFNAGSLGAVLDANTTINTLTMTGGYSGSLDFSGSVLSVLGNVDMRSGGGIIPNTGALNFLNSASVTFIPKAGTTHPSLQTTGAGTVTITTNPLTAGSLGLSSGTFHLGASMTHTLATIYGTGAIDFGTSSLNSTGNVDFSSITVTASSGNWLTFTGSSPQNFTPMAGLTTLQIQQNGTGGTTVTTNDFTTSWLSLAQGAFDLGTGRSHTVTNTLSLNSGNLIFNSSTLQVAAAAVDFSGLTDLTAGTGTLVFTGSSAQTFTPRASQTHPSIVQNGSGGTTVAAGNFTAGALTLTNGTFDLGSGRNHTVMSLGGSGGGLVFNNSTLNVSTGNASLNGFSPLTAGSGTLAFTAASGVQTLTPKSAATHPNIVHTGAGELELSAYSLTCLSFSQSAGILDFNGRNITTISSGDFTLTNGTSASLANHSGSTLTVDGNLSLDGASSTNRLNLNPGATWYLSVTGSASTTLASVANADAAGGSSIVCTNCANGGSNTNWTFGVAWDGGGGDANWSTPQNWGSDAIPSSGDDVIFNAGSLGAVLDVNTTIKSLTMSSGYSGSLDFGSSTLSVMGNADFRSGGGIIPNTGTLAFTGSGAQAFTPKAGATLPAIVQNGNAGTTTLTTHNLTAGNLTLSLGTFHLGSSLTHTVGAVSGSGALDFGVSNLNATGNVNLSGIAVTATSTNTLSFTGGAAQSYTPNTSEPDLNLTQNGAGGTTVAANFTTPLLTIAAGVFNLGASRQHAAAELAATGGGLDFGTGSWLDVSGATVDLSALASVNAGTGYLRFAGTGAQTFIPKAGATHPNIWKNGSGTTTVTANNLVAGSLTPTGGTFHMGAGLSHSFSGLSPGGGPYGSIHFGSSQVHFSGNVDLGSLPTVTAGTGSMHFDAPSGTQILVPKNGTTLPAIFHAGAGTLQLATYNLDCASFTQSGGPLDFNGRNIHTTGNLSVTGGNSATFTGLAGRTLTVDGNASFAAASTASLLNLNPGSAWTAAVTGTLDASLASLANSNASITAGNCANCTNGGSNTNWTTSISWDGGGADNLWTTAGNWGLDAVPTSADNVVFDATSTKNASLNGVGNASSIKFTSGYTGTFAWGSFTLSVYGAMADLRSGGTFTHSGGTLYFLGNGAQTLIPPSSQTLPTLNRTGTGTVTITTNPYVGTAFYLQNGTVNLGAGLTHSVTSGVDGLATATIDFGTSNLANTGSGTFDFADLAITAPGGSNTVIFNANTNNIYVPKAAVTTLHISKSGTGSTTVMVGDFTAPSFTLSAGTFILGAGRSHSIAAFTGTGGTLDFASSVLAFTGSALDLSSLAGITAGTGTLTLNSASAQTLTPKAGVVHPALVKLGTGTATLATTNLAAGNLTINNGTLNLGGGLIHTVAAVAGTAGLDFGTSNLHATGDVDLSGLTVTASSNTLVFTGAAAQTFTPKASATGLSLTQNGTGGTTVATYNFTAPALTITSGTLNLGTGRSHSAGTFSASAGGLDFGSSLLSITGATANFSGLTTLTPSSGTLAFTGSSAQTFTPKAGATFPDIAQNGTGGTTLATNALTAGALFIDNGALNLGSGLSHSVSSIGSTNGVLTFNSSTLTVTTGNAMLDNLGTVNANTGTLAFTAASGTQILTPKLGQSHPAIVHGGAGTLQLATRDLTCAAFSSSAGVVDLNGRNITTENDFTVTNGSPSTFTGLAARTLTVGGNASLAGTSAGNRLNLDPGSAWTLAVTGTLSASFATLANNAATVSSGTAANSSDGGGNSGWSFAVSWTGAGADNNWTTAANWGSGTVPSSTSIVTFDNTSVKNADLDAAGTVKAVTFTTGYTGTFSFGSNTLTVAGGNADFRSGGAIAAGTGILAFTSTSAQLFHPKAGATFPAILQNGAGGTTLSTNSLLAGDLTINAGTFNLGSGLNHGVTAVSGSGGLDFGSSSLGAGGNVDLSGLTVTASSNTLTFTGVAAQTFTPKTSATGLSYVQNGAGGTTVQTNDFTAPALSVANGTFNLGGGRTLTVGTLASSGGGIDFGTSVLRISGATADFSGLATVTPATGTLAFTGTAAQTFTPKAGASFPPVGQNGTGGTTVVVNALTATNLSIDNGTFDLGTGFSHTLGGISSTNGVLTFNNSTVIVPTGDVLLGNLGTVNAGTGTLNFTAATGTQMLIPKASQTLPAIQHSGAGTLQLATNALICRSVTQSAGVLDLNGLNITTVSSGDFTVTNGTTATFGNLAGRTLTVAGNASFSGSSSANRLNLNPASAWTAAVTGTLSANLASVQNSTASASAGACTNCANQGSNTNWTFSVSWDGGGADNNWSTAGNWGSDYVPTASDAVTFNGTSIKSATLDANASVKSITFTSAYTGTFSFGSGTLTVAAGDADFRSGGAISAATGALEIASASSQSLFPKAGAVFPDIFQSGTGSTTVVLNNLSAGDLTVSAGTFNLGASLTHTVDDVSGSGGLNFGSSNLVATGNVDFSSLSPFTAGTSNTLVLDGASPKTYAPKSGTSSLNVTVSGAGTVTFTGNVTTPTLSMTGGGLNLGSSLTHGVATTLSLTGGSLDFGSSALQVQAATVDLRDLTGITAGTGSLQFWGGSAQTLIPHATQSLPILYQYASGGTTVATNGILGASALNIYAGTFHLGAGLTHSVASLGGTGGSGEINFGSSTLKITTGNASLSLLSSVVPGTGTLEFTAASGTQVLGSLSGYSSPAMVHSGAGTLQLQFPLVCPTFAQTAGTLDLNGYNFTTTGDLNISGGSGALANLGGRTVTVGGNASFAGASGNVMNMAPGSAWTLATTGTLTADFVSLANCNASVSAGIGTNSSNAGGNTNWTFYVNWTGLGSDNNWATGANWGSGSVPGSGENVLFNGTSVKDAILGADAAVNAITFTSAYTGDFEFNGRTLTVNADADFRLGGSLLANGGTLAFAGTTAKTFIPQSGGTHPNILNSGSGTTTVTTHALAADGLSVSNGTFNLGAGFTHDLGSISGSGALDFGTSNVNATGDVNLSGLTLTAGGTHTLAFTGPAAQIYTPKTSMTALRLTQNGAGGTTVSTNGFTTPVLTVAAGTLNLGAGLTHTVSTTVAVSGGGLNFATSTLKTAAAAVDLTSLAAMVAGTGALEFTGAAAQTFTPKAGSTHPSIIQSGTGGTSIAVRDLTAGSLNISGGTWTLGTGLIHLFSSVATSGGGLAFGSSSMQVNGNANLSGLAALNAGTGILSFIAPSGTQVFTPLASTAHPAVAHAGAGTLQLSTNALSCAAFTQSAGALDFNGINVSATGDITVSNGTAASFTGLGGRTLTAGGNASFSGQAGNLVNLNPPTAWTLAVTGTLNAALAQVANSNASVAPGDAAGSVDGGGNLNWSFALTWDGGGADNNWSTGANWSSDNVPAASTKVIFDATSVKNCVLDAAATVKGIAFGTGYTGSFSFSTNTLNVTGAADFRSGGAIAPGTGTLAFAGAAPQTFTPKAAAVFPALSQNGAGGTTVAVNDLQAGALSLMNGVFNLGNGFTHSVTSIGGTGGGIHFAGSTLKVTGNADLSALGSVTPGTGRLDFSGTGSQAFSPLAAAAHPRLIQTGTGTTTVNGTGFATNSLRIGAGAFHLGTGLVHGVTDTLLATGGALNFGSSTLRTAAEAPSLAGLAVLTAGTGTLEFDGSGDQTFTPKAGVAHPALVQSGPGTTTVATNALSIPSLALNGGAMNLGAGLGHAIAAISGTGGSLDFGSSTVSLSGDADFSGLAALTAGNGSLTFTAASGTQVFKPRIGSIHPLLYHPAAGTVQLAGGKALARGFQQTAGVLDLNGQDLEITGTGDLDVGGNTAPITGLGGRTLTVGGNARFNGLPAANLDLNPPSAWTLAVTGTLKAVNARIRNNTASASAGVADSSLNLGGNANWTFVDSVKPDNVTSFLATAEGGHGVALAWTASASADADSVMLRYRTDGAYPATPADGTLWRKVAAAKTADTATGLTDKAVYHFAAFVKDSSGNYSLPAAAARDSARLPDVTPPANVTALAASGYAATATALAWTPSGTLDADSVMIRYRSGLTPPSDAADGTLWKKLPIASDKDTVTGLTANTIYAFGLFVRDSSGNYSPAAAGAQDTALYQLPVTGTIAVNDASGLTRDADPALAFTWSGADSVRFSLLADTAASAWKAVLSADSLALGGDGKKILATQFKNIYGRRSAWMRDTTLLDRVAPDVSLDLKASAGRWTWPVSVSGKSKDSLAGNDRVYVIRKRLADGFYFNGSSWSATPDTAKLVLSATDSLYSASMPAAAMATGDYRFAAYAQDRAGNVGAPVFRDVHYEDNRIPALAYASLPDTLLQNDSAAWKLDFGDLDSADTLVEVSFDAPAWLKAAPGADTTAAPHALHKVYALSGKPMQAHVGNNQVQVRLQDKGGLILTTTRNVFVVDVNDPPAFADTQATYSVKEDSVSRWKPKFKDEDPTDSHVMALLAAPAFATLNGLEITFKPLSRDVGDHTVRLTVSDGKLLDTLETVLTVVDVNDPPFAFHGTGWGNPFFFKEDQADTFTVVVVDLDKNEAVTLASQVPAWVKVTTTTDSTGYNRTFRFAAQPSQKDTGALSMALIFKDARNAASQLALNAKVLAFNDTPSAVVEETRAHAGAARFKLTVQDEDGSLEKARFHYRLVGAAGDTLRRGITPSSLLALHPLADGAYKLLVLAEDQDGLKQPTFTEAPFTISGATALSLDTARWHMIGVPHASLPASTFGSGAVLASWDEVGDDGQPMARYTSGKVVEALKRGKGYWVRLTQPAQLKAEQKDLLQGPFNLKLTHSKQGWNQIANPYPYWIDLSATKLTFWEWDADKRDLVNARGLLKPWAAYWVLAPKDTTLALADAPYFPAVQQALAKGTEPSALSRGGSLAYEGLLQASSSEEIAAAWAPSFRHREDWSVGLSLRAGFYQDRSNVFGVRAASTAHPVSIQTLDAPKFGEYIALHFEKEAEGLAADYRAALHPDEEWWDFSVENTGTGESQALLTPAGLEGLAANGLKVFLVKQGEARPVEPGESVALAMEGEKTWYSLVVTPHADFASRLKGNFSISQNFPNPVTTLTTFRFFLPQTWTAEGKRVAKDFKLRINVYDYAGRQVAQVASGSYRPGAHTLLWKPVSRDGGALSKGAYIYRLEMPNFNKSLKLLIE